MYLFGVNEHTDLNVSRKIVQAQFPWDGGTLKWGIYSMWPKSMEVPSMGD